MGTQPNPNQTPGKNPPPKGPPTKQIEINGIKINRLQIEQTTHKLAQKITTREQRHALDALVFAEMRKACTRSGSVSITYADADQVSTLEDIYDFTHVVSTIERHLNEYDLTATFQVPVPVIDSSNKMTGDLEPNKTKNLFEDHASITFDQIVDGLTWYQNWVYDPAVNQWVASDLEWSGKYLLNQMDEELREAIYDDIEAAKVPKGLQKAGPIVFKALVTRMLNTNEVTVRQYETYLQRDQVNLEQFDGNIEEFAKKYSAVISALRKCEIKDINGRTPSLIPPGLSETFLTVLISSENSLFNTAMNINLAKYSSEQAKGIKNAFPPPETILSEARQLYLQYVQSGKWERPASNQGASAFNAAGHQKGKGKSNGKGRCFGCGREGCRQTNKSCPRHGKDPTPEGIKAKQAFNDSKKKGGKNGGKDEDKKRKKWPPAPSKGESNKTQIDGEWYWFHFKSKRWILSDKDKIPTEEQKRASGADSKGGKNGANSQGGLPAALANLAKGKDQKQIELQTDLYNQRIKEAADLFAANFN